MAKATRTAPVLETLLKDFTVPPPSEVLSSIKKLAPARPGPSFSSTHDFGGFPSLLKASPTGHLIGNCQTDLRPLTFRGEQTGPHIGTFRSSRSRQRLVFDLADPRSDLWTRDPDQLTPPPLPRPVRPPPWHRTPQSGPARIPAVVASRNAVPRGRTRRRFQDPRREHPPPRPGVVRFDDRGRLRSTRAGPRTNHAESGPPTIATTPALPPSMPGLSSASRRAPSRSQVAMPPLRRGRASGATRDRQHSE